MDDYDKVINEMLKSKKMKKMYDEYVIKEITFKEWIVGQTDSLFSKQLKKKIAEDLSIIN